MRIIFLDIDGVLNSMSFIQQKPLADGEYVAAGALVNLKTIVEKTDAKIVLSSSWRSMFDEEMNPLTDAAVKLTNALASVNLSLMSKTGNIRGQRGAEVRSWLGKHSDIEAFVILDDVDFADWDDLKANLVQPDFNVGLTDGDSQKAIKILLNNQ